MSGHTGKIKIFEGKQVRTYWGADAWKWWFSITGICEALTGNPDRRKCWGAFPSENEKLNN